MSVYFKPEFLTSKNRAGHFFPVIVAVVVDIFSIVFVFVRGGCHRARLCNLVDNFVRFMNLFIEYLVVVFVRGFVNLCRVLCSFCAIEISKKVSSECEQ